MLIAGMAIEQGPHEEKPNRFLVYSGNTLIFAAAGLFYIFGNVGTRYPLYHYEPYPGWSLDLSISEVEAATIVLVLLGMLGRKLGRAKD